MLLDVARRVVIVPGFGMEGTIVAIHGPQAEIDVRGLRRVECDGHGRDEVPPCLRRRVVRMPAPHIDLIARSGAEGDEARPQ